MINQTPGRLEVVVATKSEELLQFRQFWESANNAPDLDFEFYSWLIKSRPEVVSPYVIALLESGEPKALLIGRLEFGHARLTLGYADLAKIKILQITFPRCCLVGECSRENAALLISKVLQSLNDGIADRAFFDGLDLTSDLYRLCRMTPFFLCRDVRGGIYERWSANLPNTLDEFLLRVSSKHRKQLRRCMRYIEEQHPGRMRFCSYQKLEQVDSFCTSAEAVARKTYQWGLGVSFMNTVNDRHRLELAANQGWLRAYIIFLDNTPVAYAVGRLYRGMILFDWTGFDPAFQEYEPGTVVFLKMIEDLCALKVSVFDFGSGAAFYKQRFGDKNNPEIEVAIYASTLKGVVVNTLLRACRAANRAAKYIMQKLNVRDKIKKIWRVRLSKVS